MFDLPAIIDIEASGFSADSYPIEIGIASRGGESRFCTLIRPSEDWQHWDKEAAAVHRIKRQTLYIFGRSPLEVARLLNGQFANQTLYSDGWVVDKPWINRLFNAAGIEMEFFVSPLEMILKEEQLEPWHATKQQVIAELQLKRHRASNDALIVQETYRRTRLAMMTQSNLTQPTSSFG